MTKKFSSATDRFRVVWRSQCNGGQKRERRECPVRILPDEQKMLLCIEMWLQNYLSLALHINFNAF